MFPNTNYSNRRVTQNLPREQIQSLHSLISSIFFKSKQSQKSKSHICLWTFSELLQNLQISHKRYKSTVPTICIYQYPFTIATEIDMYRRNRRNTRNHVNIDKLSESERVTLNRAEIKKSPKWQIFEWRDFYR